MAKVNLDVSEELDITCRKGDTFHLRVTINDSDGTGLQLETSGYQFMMQVRGRRKVNGQRPLIIGTAGVGPQSPNNTDFTVSSDDSGNLNVVLSDTLMEGVDTGRYVYDLQQILSNTTTTILKGSFRVVDDISKFTQPNV